MPQILRKQASKKKWCFRHNPLETTSAEMLVEYHTPTEVEYVFKHFQGKGSILAAK
ncbi:MAG: hypothetical protein OXN25_07195 [Candidatus Poribacteria bacterium]|nr:hypothetical protein [Candidatus Poribacteria bacterium]